MSRKGEFVDHNDQVEKKRTGGGWALPIQKPHNCSRVEGGGENRPGAAPSVRSPGVFRKRGKRGNKGTWSRNNMAGLPDGKIVLGKTSVTFPGLLVEENLQGPAMFVIIPENINTRALL